MNGIAVLKETRILKEGKIWEALVNGALDTSIVIRDTLNYEKITIEMIYTCVSSFLVVIQIRAFDEEMSEFNPITTPILAFAFLFSVKFLLNSSFFVCLFSSQGVTLYHSCVFGRFPLGFFGGKITAGSGHTRYQTIYWGCEVLPEVIINVPIR